MDKPADELWTVVWRDLHGSGRSVFNSDYDANKSMRKWRERGLVVSGPHKYVLAGKEGKP